MQQQQDDRASAPNKNSFDTLDAEDGFFPTFSAHGFVRHKLCSQIRLHQLMPPIQVALRAARFGLQQSAERLRGTAARQDSSAALVQFRLALLP
jgi:hypothetical protein